MRLLWLLLFFLSLARAHQPRCKLTTLSSQAPGTKRGEVSRLLHQNPHKWLPLSSQGTWFAWFSDCLHLPFVPAKVHGQPELREGGAGRGGQARRWQVGRRPQQLLATSPWAQLPHSGQAAHRPEDREQWEREGGAGGDGDLDVDGDALVQVDLAARDELLDGVPHVQGLTVRYVDELVLQGAISCNMCAKSTLLSTNLLSTYLCIKTCSSLSF